MKVKITYTAKHENAARATLNALRAMYPVARVHYSQNGEIRIPVEQWVQFRPAGHSRHFRP